MATTEGSSNGQHSLSPSEQRGKSRLASLFESPSNLQKCHRCEATVYQAEKIGPVKGVVFHKQCFRCNQCGQHLTLKNYTTNQVDVSDKNVYCQVHAPKTVAKGLGNEAIGIRGALAQQKMQSDLGKKGNIGQAPLIDAQSLAIKGALHAPKAGGRVNEQIHQGATAGHIDANALHIRGALNTQAQYQKGGKMPHGAHQYPAYVIEKKGKIIEAQKVLEERQRLEEDALYKTFRAEREDEKRKLSQELDQEWEIKLKDLTEKFEKEFGKKAPKKGKEGDFKVNKSADKSVAFTDDLEKTLSPDELARVSHLTMQFEQQKKELENSMTAKRDNKKKYMTLKLVQKEQQLAGDLVAKHSQEMLELIAIKQKEIKQELQQEIEMAKQESVTLENGQVNGGEVAMDDLIMQAEEALKAMSTMDELPPPRPAACKKRELYEDPSVFTDLDEYVFKIADSEHSTWTDLVQQLTAPCLSDLEKVRAIFRWITVKDLNVIEFDETVVEDTPLGLLRGIKYGTETYHVLFMRLCSYAGLHCVEIKGKSKSVGYEPGMKFRDDMFNNTWNAVLVDRQWRLVQCNWGARHLVLNKDNEAAPAVEKSEKRRDKIRYQYDEHYFLTDPEEFIMEFMADDPDWQLLPTPITIKEFEELPFVRSVFFHFGMNFLDNPKSVIYTNTRGGAEVKIRVSADIVRDVVFHYQLRFAQKEKKHETDYKGAKLDRFVFQSMMNDHVIYSVHVPTTGDYFLEIFANKIDDSHKIGEDPNAPMMPFRLKCACKFRVVCETLTNKMHPLPNCAAGEWGPEKSVRHFNLIPLTHKSGVVTTSDSMEMQFRMPRKLHFVTKLRMNGIDDHFLDRFVKQSISGDVVTLSVQFPQTGQFGLDIYARPVEASDNHTLAHACKYLINVDKVSNPVELELTRPENASTHMSKEKWGPTSLFDKFGMKCINYRDPKIKLNSTNQIVVEFSVPETLQVSYHFLREPDEDHRDNVTIVREDSNKIAKFFINMIRPGNYLLAVYAKFESDPGKKMANVYNYMIKYAPDDGSLGKKKSGLFRK
ncbi:hillarin isoform X2 [Lingula anatina]|uniref:Hillarin isoform X2 n=1 Tax=Lingula anatina TaxID=7574 RepID=A0A1S3JFJ4_LINAN|nr:hillarin isoform X2 [Lingula anatina]|eukprot:XP_013409108.1 hillarin isoform X2 [Lingula anatina]